MTLAEIQSAVAAGKIVHWSHRGYVVKRDTAGQWFVLNAQTQHAIGLTWNGGVTLNGKPEQFFVG